MILLIVSWILGWQASAAPLDDVSYLHKIKMHLVGQKPTPAEYQALAEAQKRHEAPLFLQNKIQEYLSSQGHIIKMNYRLEEMFQLKTSSQVQPGKDVYNFNNSLNYLFMDIAQKNLSWDALLTAKSYKLFKIKEGALNVLGAPMSDYGFYGLLVPDLPYAVNGVLKPRSSAPVPDSVDVQFALDDVRVAGALTTPRFFDRYTNTSLNKNRRRAAGVFKIFLCDSMQAAVPPPPSDQGGLLDKAYPDTSFVTENEVRLMAARGDAHGANPDCAKCHYKLDPMGQVFDTSPVILSSWASPGQLVYKTKTSQLVQVPVRGIGELAAAITQQKEYVDCQVDRFWQWFIGKDRPLTDERRVQLTEAFNRMDRRTNDFISHLVSSREFRELDLRTPSEVRAAKVKSVLSNCTSCHDAPTPDFTVWPIGGNMPLWVQQISQKLDLPNNGLHRTMPPSWSSWQPSAKEIELLKLWVEDGAPNEKGDRQI